MAATPGQAGSQRRRPGLKGPARWTTGRIHPLAFYVIFAGLSAVGLVLQWRQHAGAISRHPDFYLRAWLGSAPLALVFVAVILWLDRHEREPWRLLLIAFLWGALGSRAILWPAVDLLEQVQAENRQASATPPRQALAEQGLPGLAGASIRSPRAGTATGYEQQSAAEDVSQRQVAQTASKAFLEEVSKAAIVLLLFLLLPHEFNGVLDGIIYGALVGFGFAMLENVRYLYVAQADPGPGLCAAQAFRQAMLDRLPGFPGHAMLAGLFGAGLGLARTAPRPWQKWLAPLLGFVLAGGLHTLWNSLPGDPVINKVLLVFGPLVLLYLPLLILSWRREQRALAHHLPPAAATAYTLPGDMPHRRRRWGALRQAFRASGWPGLRAAARLQKLLIEWALVRWHTAEGHLAAGVDVDDIEHRYQAQTAALTRALGAPAPHRDPF